ncbi:hypothetical protein [Bacillus sp. AFS053548]|nr:hypothetical protein [Bacillus sp. AFS053548]
MSQSVPAMVQVLYVAAVVARSQNAQVVGIDCQLVKQENQQYS